MRLLRAQEVATILDTTSARVYALIRGGLLPVVRLGRQIRISERALEEWIAHGGQALPGGWRRELATDDERFPGP